MHPMLSVSFGWREGRKTAELCGSCGAGYRVRTDDPLFTRQVVARVIMRQDRATALPGALHGSSHPDSRLTTPGKRAYSVGMTNTTAPLSTRILDALTDSPLNLDEIAARVDSTSQQVSHEIALLNTDGRVASTLDGWTRA